MVKTILIPVDFCVESLNTLKLALEDHKEEHVDLILVYAEYLADSITSLLFYSRYKSVQEYSKAAFNDGLAILKNSYSSVIRTMRIEFFQGCHVHVFKIFAETNHIDLAYIPENYSLQLRKWGIDPIPLIKKSGLAYKTVSWTGGLSDQDHLQQLFNHSN